MKYSYMFLILALIACFSLINSETINIDLVSGTPYIDYVITFDSNFSINLPDYKELVYIKALPENLNYEIKDSKLTILDNLKGAVILKYKGTNFFQGSKSKEKTLKFDLIKSSKITLRSDENIIEVNTGYTKEDNSYIWQTNNNEFILLIKLYKSTFDLKTIIIIIVCLVIIAVILFPKLLEKYKNKKHNKGLFLDNNQTDILDLVRKGNGATQQDIANKLNIKKSHMSKILNKMERNDLIERKRVGKVNKIVLKDNK